MYYKTHAACRVAAALLADPEDQHWYGARLIEATGLRSGTLYPILARMAAAGWLDGSRWESTDPRSLERPARHYYTVTAAGREALAALQEMGVHLDRI